MTFDDVLAEWNAGAEERLARPETLRKLARFRTEQGRSNRTILADQVLKGRERVGVLLHTHTLLPDEPIVLHNHDYFELAYLHSGRAMHYHAGGEMALVPGDVVFLNPYVRHEMRINDGSCLINLIFRPAFMQQSVAGNLTDAPPFSDYVLATSYLVQRRLDFIHVSAQATGAEQIRALIESTAVECYQRQPGWESACVGYVSALFVTLSREHAASVGSTEAPALVTDILKYLESHRTEVSLGMVASTFGYSASHISRLLRRHTGKGFAEIVGELRLEQAQEYLERTSLPIEAVAKRSGFATASYLTRVFGRRYGVPPGLYRSLRRQSQE